MMKSTQIFNCYRKLESHTVIVRKIDLCIKANSIRRFTFVWIDPTHVLFLSRQHHQTFLKICINFTDYQWGISCHVKRIIVLHFASDTTGSSNLTQTLALRAHNLNGGRNTTNTTESTGISETWIFLYGCFEYWISSRFHSIIVWYAFDFFVKIGIKIISQ